MKKTSLIKLCWFCEKKCYHFVSICPECDIVKRKKIKPDQSGDNSNSNINKDSDKKTVL
jgi:hypothetical protein